jgi:ribonuclease T1
VTEGRRALLLVAVLAIVAIMGAAALGRTIDGGGGVGPGGGAGNGQTVPSPTLRVAATPAVPVTTAATHATAAAVAPRIPAASIRTTTSIPPIDGDGIRTIAMAALPKEARLMLDVIAAGAPFRYSEDGSTFGNVERHLPIHATGYYREYTVETPGSPDRGARRIVTGRGGERYWTADHYASFRRILA